MSEYDGTLKALTLNDEGRKVGPPEIVSEFEGEPETVARAGAVRWAGSKEWSDKTERYNEWCRAHFRRMVEAANHYDALLAAARAVVEDWDKRTNRRRWKPLDALRAALSDATEGAP